MMEKVDTRFKNLLSRLKSLDWHDGSSRLDFIFETTEELIDNGEQGIALENLCENLYEFAVKISTQDLDDIKVIAKTMQMPDTTWAHLLEIVA